MPISPIKYAAIAAAFGLFTGAATLPAYADDASGGTRVNMENPLKPYPSVEEASNALGFRTPLPNYMPSGYNQKVVQTISGDTLEVIYRNDDDKDIRFRAAKGEKGDITGDHRSTTNRTITSQGRAITAKMASDNRVSSAYWENGGMTFAVNFRDPIDESEFKRIADEFPPAN